MSHRLKSRIAHEQAAWQHSAWSTNGPGAAAIITACILLAGSIVCTAAAAITLICVQVMQEKPPTVYFIRQGTVQIQALDHAAAPSAPRPLSLLPLTFYSSLSKCCNA